MIISKRILSVILAANLLVFCTACSDGSSGSANQINGIDSDIIELASQDDNGSSGSANQFNGIEIGQH